MPWVVTKTTRHPGGEVTHYLTDNGRRWTASRDVAQIYRTERGAEEAATSHGGDVTPWVGRRRLEAARG